MAHTDHASEKGQASGLATLDAGSKVPIAQLDVGTAVGKLVQVADVGGSPGLPALDGSLLTGVTASEPPDRVNPGEHLPFGIAHYDEQRKFDDASEIQYVRMWLSSGTVIASMRTWLGKGSAVGRNVRMAIYDQVSPLSTTGVPNNRVAQTASTTTDGTTDAYLTAALEGGTYTVTTEGYYWLALITDSKLVEFETTKIYPAGFMGGTRREAGSGVVLPATAGTLTNPRSAIAYCSAVDQ